MSRRNHELSDIKNPRMRAQAAAQLAAQGVKVSEPTPNPPRGDSAPQSAPKRNKYGNTRTVVDGIKFDSLGEAKRYSELKLERDVLDLVNWFVCHPRFDFPIEGGLRYEADFMIVYASGEIVVEDFKGMQTQVFKNKLKLMKTFYPTVNLKIVS